ncbi:hypothetical protein MC885_013353, partial [Smutsia gigantea]
NSEIRLRADKRSGESETHQKLVCGVPGTWEPLQPAVRVEGRLPASQPTAPAEGREPEAQGPATGGGGGVEGKKGEHERERKQPNLGACYLGHPMTDERFSLPASPKAALNQINLAIKGQDV